jgi:hypothetical protein
MMLRRKKSFWLLLCFAILSACSAKKSRKINSVSTEVNPVTKLLLVGPSSSVAGSCAGPFQTQTADSKDVPQDATEDTSFTLTGLGTAALFTDGACATSVSNLQISEGTDHAFFYLKDSNYNHDALPMTLLLRAESSTLSASATLFFQENFGPAARLVYTTQPSASVVEQSVFSIQPTLKILDANGNKVANSAASITLSPMTNSSCSTAADGVLSSNTATSTSGAVSFSGVKYSKPATIYLRAASGNLATACSSAVVVSALPVGPATRLVLSGPASAVAGTCAGPFQVQAQNNSGGAGTVSQNTPITIAGLISAFLYTSNSCTTTTSPIIPSGSSSVSFYLKDTGYDRNALPLTLNLVAQSSTLSASPAFNFQEIVGPASQLTFTRQPNANSIVLTDFSTQVAVRDPVGNISLNFLGSVTLTPMTDASCTLPASGILFGSPVSVVAGLADFTVVKYSQPETIYLRATSPGLSSACSTSVTVAPQPIATHRLSITLSGDGTGVVQSGRSNAGQNLVCRNVPSQTGSQICSVEAPVGTKFKIFGFSDTNCFLAGFSGTTCTYDPAVASDIKNCNIVLNNDLAIDVVFHLQTQATGSLGDPNLTNIAATSVSRTSATIEWNTATLADSAVRFGTTVDYGNTSSLDPAMTLQHKIILQNLSPGTKYFFRVLSRDPTNLLFGSVEGYQFTTSAN